MKMIVNTNQDLFLFFFSVGQKFFVLGNGDFSLLGSVFFVSRVDGVESLIPKDEKRLCII